MRLRFVLLAAVIPLAGCASVDKGSLQSLSPVCEALDGPILYNSKNKNSAYHAGPKLAPQLAERNSIGLNLNCPAYTHPDSTPAMGDPAPKPKPKPTFMQRFQQVWR